MHLPETSRPLNVLVSSTRQWNPGDEFILRGVRRLVETAVQQSINWLLWNRNPDLFVNRWHDPRLRTDFLTNSLRHPGLDTMDFVVLAGTPEWTGPAVREVYRELLKHPDVPLLALGVGSGTAAIELEDYEQEVLRRENALVTTRSAELADCLNQQLGQAKAVPLPCPALFFAPDATHGSPPRGMAVVLQSSAVENQRISEDLVNDVLAWLASRGPAEAEVVCLYVDEFSRFSRALVDRRVRYSYEPLDYAELLSGYEVVVSTRLHGAIAALSCGVPAVAVARDEFRIESTCRPFGDLLPCGDVDEAFATAMSWLDADTQPRRDRIRALRHSAREQYLGLIGAVLDGVPA